MVDPAAAGLDPDAAPPANVCPACGARFTCGMNAGQARCWCATLPLTLAVPADVAAGSTAACLCPECLALRVNGVAPPA